MPRTKPNVSPEQAVDGMQAVQLQDRIYQVEGLLLRAEQLRPQLSPFGQLRLCTELLLFAERLEGALDTLEVMAGVTSDQTLASAGSSDGASSPASASDSGDSEASSSSPAGSAS